MQLCFKNNRTRERFEQIRQWHIKYIKFPRFVKFTNGTRCFIWLEYVQRRYNSTSYDFYLKWGTFGEWEYKSGRELN